MRSDREKVAGSRNQNESISLVATLIAGSNRPHQLGGRLGVIVRAATDFSDYQVFRILAPRCGVDLISSGQFFPGFQSAMYTD